LDFLHSKGSVLDAFRREYLDLQKSSDMTLAINTGKEREVDVLNQEYKALREQLFFTKRNIDEVVSQQEVLKEKIDNINLTKESLVEREASNREEISLYSGYFAELKEAISVGADWSPEQLEQRIILEKERDFSFSKYENRLGMLTGLRGDVDRTYVHIQHLEEKYNALDNKIASVDKKRHDTKKETDKLLQKKETTEKRIYDLRAKLLEGENEITERKKHHNAEDKSLKDLDVSIAKSKQRMEVFIGEYDQLFHTLTDLTSELDKQNSQNKKLEEEIHNRKLDMEVKATEIKKAKKELERINQLRELTKKKCQEADEERQATMEKVDQLTEKVQAIRDHDLVAMRKDIESVDKQASNSRQELEIVRKKHLNSEKTARAMADLIQLNKNGKINLTLEIKLLTDEVQNQKNQIRQLLVEKEKFEHDAEVANQQYYTALEELKLQELQAQELNKKISADRSKLKQKQTLYESVRSDRNLYSKQLIDSQEEINSLRRNFRSMNHSIDQMKEEISIKDHAIVKEHFQHHSVDKDKEILKNEITKIKKQLNSSNVIMENQRIEIVKLQRIIEEADAESTRQKNELSAVASERTLLTGQLVKRNYELTEMYEQIKVQRSNLRIGESNYAKYLENLATWQRSMVDVVGSHNDTITGLAKIEEFRFRAVQLEREVLKEKTRSRALADELEVPMNVHRWRILESSDPKRYEKVLQVQQLQKQLIEFSDKVTQIDLLIQEKEKIYVELKSVIARQPGPEVEEQLLVYQQTLKDKVKQLTAMDQELAMYMEQVGKFKEEIADIDSEMTRIGKKWMKQRRAKEIKN